MSRFERLTLTGTLAVYLGLCSATARHTSATFDEVAHLPAAYTHLAELDYRMTPEHPPLAKHWAALPLVLGGAHFKPDDEAYRLRRPWELGKRFLYRWNDADRLLFQGRMMNAALGAALIAAIALTARKRGGPVAFLIALALAASHPDFLAHGPLVTTDVGAALLVFLSVLQAERLTGGLTPGRVVALGVLSGAALATKLSALMLLPVLLALALVLWREGACPRRLALAAVAVALVAGATVWAAYGGRSAISRDPAVEADIDWAKQVREAPVIAVPVMALRNAHALPEGWLYGFLRFFTSSEDVPAFLHGRRSEGGFSEYFLFTFLLKTPIPLLLLLTLAVARPADSGLGGTSGAFLWIPVAVLAALTATRGIQIGHRHLLPAYPFLILIASLAASRLWARTAQPVRGSRPARAAQVARVGLALLLLFRVGDALALQPDHLSFFNALAGGPRNGWRWLVDSNLDWGQDLKALAAWQKAEGVPKLKLSYFGTADAEYHGLACDFLPGYQLPRPKQTVWQVDPGDIVVVSATNLQKVYLPEAAWPLMDRLRERTPRARIGNSLFAYQVDFSWRGEPAEAQ